MWARRLRWTGPGGLGAEELRVRRREREAALRKARREQHLVSKRLLREETEAEDGAGMVPEPLSEAEVLELLRGMQRGSEERKRSLKQLHRALRNKETQQKFVRLDGSIRTLLGVFTSPLADIQMEAAHCLHELSHSSDPAVAEACLPATPYLLTYLSGHSVEFMELCLYTLGNLVVESEAVRKQLLPQGIIPVLASCIQLGAGLSSPPAHAPTGLLWSEDWDRSSRGVCLVSALHHFHTATRSLLSLGALPALTSLLLHLASEIPPNPPEGLELLVCPVLRCLSNLLAEQGFCCQNQVLDQRLLVALFLILQSFLQHHPFMAQECLCLLNNLTADEPFFCSALLSLDLLPALLQLLSSSQMVRVLVLTVLCNVAVQGAGHCRELLRALPLLLSLLLPLLALPGDTQVLGQGLELLHLLFLHCPEPPLPWHRLLLTSSGRVGTRSWSSTRASQSCRRGQEHCWKCSGSPQEPLPALPAPPHSLPSPRPLHLPSLLPP
ncbi:transmembrane and coiled-coil domain-containing protein 6 isoform X3 [Heliangelus exortis]|uniref:transmembrane and coiled-coil domain-containing protein 6 isoform X3 n=1 Tax=Heliangelus exortis TaxID=472823 RepID=UPI003A8E5232